MRFSFPYHTQASPRLPTRERRPGGYARRVLVAATPSSAREKDMLSNWTLGETPDEVGHSFKSWS